MINKRITNIIIIMITKLKLNSQRYIKKCILAHFYHFYTYSLDATLPKVNTMAFLCSICGSSSNFVYLFHLHPVITY